MAEMGIVEVAHRGMEEITIMMRVAQADGAGNGGVAQR